MDVFLTAIECYSCFAVLCGLTNGYYRNVHMRNAITFSLKILRMSYKEPRIKWEESTYMDPGELEPVWTTFNQLITGL
jgi:hypothetical protein